MSPLLSPKMTTCHLLLSLEAQNGLTCFFWFFCRTLPSLIVHPAPLHSAQFHLLDLVSFNIFLQELVTSMWIWLFYDFRSGASQVALVKNPPANADTQETWVPSLGQEDPLEEEMATHSNILAWKIPWTEELGGLQSMGSQRVGHNWVTEHMTFVQPLFGVFILLSKALNIFLINLFFIEG